MGCIFTSFHVNTTLCIPTIFVSYTGEALDYKTPLLKTLSALDKAAVKVCQYFDKDVNRVIATLGWEQEYFLIDEALYYARPRPDACRQNAYGSSVVKGSAAFRPLFRINP